jgi:monoterpene epsilon-lactone hydrolase
MIKNSIDVLSASSTAFSSMLLRPKRGEKRSWGAEFTCRLVQRLLRKATQEPDQWLRETQDLLAMRGPALRKVVSSREKFEGVECLQCVPKDLASEGGAASTIVYFHGGGYVVGSTKSYHYTLAKLALLCKARVIGVDYRLAPEHRLPCAQQDCMAVVEHVLDEVDAQHHVYLAGDSAGGGLVLHCLQELKKVSRVAGIDGAVMLSPWVSPYNFDILSTEYCESDILSPEILHRWTSSLGDDPAAVAQVADFSESSFIGLPPIYIQAGGSELFKAQIDRLVKRLRSDNVQTAYDVFPNQFHVFQTLSPLVPEADRALVLIAKKLEHFV